MISNQPENVAGLGLEPAGATSISAEICLELRAGLPVDEVDRRLAVASRVGDVGARAMAFYLADLARRGAHQQMGYRSITLCAELRYHVRPSTAREYVAAGRALEELPLIAGAFDEGGLSWSQVRLLTRIAVPETERQWLEWAAGRTVRQIAAHIRYRDKGQRPTDPARRRIHGVRFRSVSTFNVLQWEMLNKAKARLAAETGRPATDSDVMLWAITKLLTTREDGTVPGRVPVDDPPMRFVVYGPDGGGSMVMLTADGPVPVEPETARAIRRQLGLDPAEEPVDDDNENDGPPVPPEERDRPTPPALREEILARDGYRCLNCNGVQNPTAHHKKFRRNGGPTERENLMTSCEDCHSLIHGDLLIVRGSIPDALRFTDANGRDVREFAGPGDDRLKLVPAVDARASTSAWLDSRNLPGEVDADWWARHAHLLPWNKSEGTLELRPGVPADDVPEGPVAAGQGAARAARSQRLADMVGQRRAVRSLRTAVRAARRRGAPLPHILLVGQPGLGKTSLACAVANEVEAGFHQVLAPAVKDPAVLLRLLTSLRDDDVIFIDELHRLPVRVAEVLYQAMEDGTLSLQVRCGRQQRTLHVSLRRFTVIGATTDHDRLPPPLQSRFRIRQRLELYAPDELVEVLRRAARRLGVAIDDAATRDLAAVSRGTPREALGLLHGAWDEAVAAGRSAIDRPSARRALGALGIDRAGLDSVERQYLRALEEDGPLSLSTLAARLDVPKRTLRDVHERRLIHLGLVRITRQGRALVATSSSPAVPVASAAGAGRRSSRSRAG